MCWMRGVRCCRKRVGVAHVGLQLFEAMRQLGDGVDAAVVLVTANFGPSIAMVFEATSRWLMLRVVCNSL